MTGNSIIKYNSVSTILLFITVVKIGNVFRCASINWAIPRFRIHLRHAGPKRLLTDHDLESKISPHLLYMHKLESRKYLLKSKTWNRNNVRLNYMISTIKREINLCFTVLPSRRNEETGNLFIFHLFTIKIRTMTCASWRSSTQYVKAMVLSFITYSCCGKNTWTVQICQCIQLNSNTCP